MKCNCDMVPPNIGKCFAPIEYKYTVINSELFKNGIKFGDVTKVDGPKISFTINNGNKYMKGQSGTIFL